jgi:hypothetical protein
MLKIFLIFASIMLSGCAGYSPYFGKMFFPIAPYSDKATGYIKWTTDPKCLPNWYNVGERQPRYTEDQKYEYGYSDLVPY